MKISLWQKASLILLAGLAVTKGIEAQERKDPRPNVIFILADDAGYGDFGSYGQKEILTPNLDRMAAEGILFTDHYAGAPVCAPSRSALLTGQHTGHTPLRGIMEVEPEGQHPLPEEAVTVAEILQQADVETAVIGKWGLGYPGSEGTPDKQGFDYFFGYNCQRQAHNYYPDHLWENDTVIPLDGGTYTHDLFTDKAISWMEDQNDNPFFLYLAYAIPHAALQVPDLAPYREKDWPEDMKKFAAMMTRMDSDVGRILEKLEELGIDDETLVLFSSDNGPHNEGGADPEFFDSSGPFRGMKRDLYEGGIRVPLIARWPGTIEGGKETGHVSAFWDFLPTMAELYGLDFESETDGLSYLPVMLGREEQQKKHESLYWEFHENGGIQAVRMGDWKGVRKFVRLFPRGGIELYNLADDPGETKDVSGANKEISEKIQVIMDQSHREASAFPLVGKTPFKPGLYNGWLFLLPLILARGIVSLIGILRKDKKERKRAKWASILNMAATGSLMLISIFSPLMLMSRWFNLSIAGALAGIFLYSLKGAKLKWLPELGLMIFWISLGASIPSWPFIIALILWAVIRVFAGGRIPGTSPERRTQ